jgi:hypothetical protein
VTGDAEAADGEHVLQALGQAGSRIGVIGPQLGGQATGDVEALGQVGVVERSGQARVDRSGQLVEQVVGDVLGSPALTAGPPRAS